MNVGRKDVGYFQAKILKQIKKPLAHHFSSQFCGWKKDSEMIETRDKKQENKQKTCSVS